MTFDLWPVTLMKSGHVSGVWSIFVNFVSAAYSCAELLSSEDSMDVAPWTLPLTLKTLYAHSQDEYSWLKYPLMKTTK